jgi:general secretion pathway protein F
VGAFRYRAVTSAGGLRAGVLEGASPQDVTDQLRRAGLTLIEARPVKAAAPGRPEAAPAKRISRKLLAKVFGELAVVLGAGVPLDRALAIVLEDLDKASDRVVFEGVLRAVQEGRPLSRALSEAGAAFPAMAAPMVAAGEADGRPAAALGKLAETLERAEALRSTLLSAAVYPSMLLVIAAGVIALMLFWVVPQFETLFSDAHGSLPVTTQVVLAISHGARRYGLVLLAAACGALFVLAQLSRRADVKRWSDRVMLKTPQLGAFIAMTESARFVRVMAALLQGGVALPDALAIARRSLQNGHMGAAVDGVARGLREGEGLTGPLTATGVFPRLALSYLRTGEETAQLPMMLDRLADTLDREVRIRLERFIGILTPLITVSMGAIVAVVIASIMTAILGFDDLALAQ